MSEYKKRRTSDEYGSKLQKLKKNLADRFEVPSLQGILECESSIDQGLFVSHGDHIAAECTPEKHKSGFKFVIGTSGKKPQNLSKKRSKEILIGSSWELTQNCRAEELLSLDSLYIHRIS